MCHPSRFVILSEAKDLRSAPLESVMNFW
jgi:hypothetical protein